MMLHDKKERNVELHVAASICKIKDLVRFYLW